MPSYGVPTKVSASPRGSVLTFKSDADAEAYRKEVISTVDNDVYLRLSRTGMEVHHPYSKPT
jgi:hypothetical protein